MSDSGKLVPAKDRLMGLRSLILKNQSAIATALPRHLTPDRFTRIVLTCLSTNPALLDCTQRSFLGAVVQAAQLGLELGLLGQAYIVPFENRKAGTTEAQLIIGYRGLLQLARNSGQVSTIHAYAVYRDDTFSYELGTDPKIHHKRDDAGRQGPAELTHVYAWARLKDGGLQIADPWSRMRLEAHRDRYARAAKAGPWASNYVDMCLKTALRDLCKMLPANTDHMARAVAIDETAAAQLPQHFDEVIDISDAVEVQETPIDSLTKRLEAEVAAGA